MRKPEQRLHDSFVRNMPSAWWIQRVENVLVAGMPDVWVAPGFPSREVWIELKAPDAKKRATSLLMGEKQGLNADQINWHLKAASKGVDSYVLVRAGSELFLFMGSDAATMNSWSVAEGEARRVAADWYQVMEALK